MDAATARRREVPPTTSPPRHMRCDYLPLLPGIVLGEPPLLPAPLPPEPLRLVPLELPEAPPGLDGTQSAALLPLLPALLLLEPLLPGLGI